jgi:hypothetical protein
MNRWAAFGMLFGISIRDSTFFYTTPHGRIHDIFSCDFEYLYWNKDAIFSFTDNVDAIYEDINALNRSKQQLQITPTTHISSSFQLTTNRTVGNFKRWLDALSSKSDRIFWNLEHHCVWMLIYWLSDTFEAFSELFKAIGTHSSGFHSVNMSCLISCSWFKKRFRIPSTKPFAYGPWVGLDHQEVRTYDTCHRGRRYHLVTNGGWE